MSQVFAPWTAWQVANLIRWQGDQRVHPFTCGKEMHDNPMGSYELIPTPGGWICPQCDFTQDWAHSFMTGDWDHPRSHVPDMPCDPFLDDVWFCTQCHDSVSWDELDMTWFEAGTQKCAMCAKANPYVPGES